MFRLRRLDHRRSYLFPSGWSPVQNSLALCEKLRKRIASGLLTLREGFIRVGMRLTHKTCFPPAVPRSYRVALPSHVRFPCLRDHVARSHTTRNRTRSEEARNYLSRDPSSAGEVRSLAGQAKAEHRLRKGENYAKAERTKLTCRDKYAVSCARCISSRPARSLIDATSDLTINVALSGIRPFDK